MSDIALRVENLSKRYIIKSTPEQAASYKTLRESVSSGVKRAIQRVMDPSGGRRLAEDRAELWALQDVSFEVRSGERVGIIGRNGAGKSTLLKIISRITTPTAGRVSYRGRLGSLLEVGTGFHQELTGRENIFMNASILGMTRAEIRKNFDAIVDFSGVERFLDTPVKRYSSGMYVRLAFAVAAHTDPDILIVDEVLSVGDSAFQRKCLNRMRELEKENRTVLFVSHNLAAVNSLCSSAIVLNHGKVVHPLDGVGDAMRTYADLIRQENDLPLGDRPDRQGEGSIRFAALRWYRNGDPADTIARTSDALALQFMIERRTPKIFDDVSIAVGVYSTTGGLVTLLESGFDGTQITVNDDQTAVTCVIDRLPLSEGSYSLNLMLRSNRIIQDWIQDAALLNVEYGDFFGTGAMPGSGHSCMLVKQQWKAA